MQAEPKLNIGVITARLPPLSAGPRTLIVTGIARSGTSMVAGLLHQAGVFMGEYLREVVVEDAQILELLRTRRMDALRQLIGERNATYPVWGFKLPNLHGFLRLDELALFRNPHLVLVFRDPVAVAVRSALAEHYDMVEAMAAAATAQDSLLQVVRRWTCPLLLLSYEKALVTPQAVIGPLLDFCGVAIPDAARVRLADAVQANRPEYLAIASSSFEGCIDGLVDGKLVGWCRQVDRLDPVPLEVLANGIPLLAVLADRFRADLVDAGMGNGCHGFVADLAPYQLSAEVAVRVRIRDRVLDLQRSGCRLGDLPLLGQRRQPVGGAGDSGGRRR